MPDKPINWRFYAGCLAVGLMLGGAYTIGTLYGPSRIDPFAFTDVQRDRAMRLCRSEIGIDTAMEVRLCMMEELMAGSILNMYMVKHPGSVDDSCLTLKALIGNRLALSCAMGRTGKTKAEASDPGLFL